MLLKHCTIYKLIFKRNFLALRKNFNIQNKGSISCFLSDSSLVLSYFKYIDFFFVIKKYFIRLVKDGLFAFFRIVRVCLKNAIQKFFFFIVRKKLFQKFKNIFLNFNKLINKKIQTPKKFKNFDFKILFKFFYVLLK